MLVILAVKQIRYTCLSQFVCGHQYQAVFLSLPLSIRLNTQYLGLYRNDWGGEGDQMLHFEFWNCVTLLSFACDFEKTAAPSTEYLRI